MTKYLRVKVNYTDGQGSGKSATSVSRGPIGASNSEPTFDDGSTATRTLAENPAMVTDVETPSRPPTATTATRSSTESRAGTTVGPSPSTRQTAS